ncbi:MAG: hypothetical protein QY326_05735 [Bdellovibrionota bacterium]|nr:MAG: hypothetical protein QY326_05735 [Bdellovibrionota bacterium]
MPKVDSRQTFGAVSFTIESAPWLRAGHRALDHIVQSGSEKVPENQADTIVQEMGPDKGKLLSELRKIAATTKGFLYMVAAAAHFEDPQGAVKLMAKEFNAGEGFKFVGGKVLFSKVQKLAHPDKKQITPLKIDTLKELALDYVGGDWFRGPERHNRQLRASIDGDVNEVSRAVDRKLGIDADE